MLTAHGGGSDDSVHGGDMNGCRSLVLWQRHSTTPPGPSLRRATRGWWRVPRTTPYEARTQSQEPERWRSASCTMRRGVGSLLHRGRGRLQFRSRDRRRGSSGTRGSATSWFSTPWCRRWMNSWWKFRCLRSLWSTSLPRPLRPKLPCRWWSILHPCPRCFMRLRQLWRPLHPRQQFFLRQRLW